MAKGEKEQIENTAIETFSDDSRCSAAASVLSEPSLSQWSSHSVLSELSGAASLEPTRADFCEEPVLRAIIVLRYDGEMCNDLFHGEGTAYFHGGHVYKGAFSKGHMHGRGVYAWADGVQYEGEFIFNTPLGYGKYTWHDGSCYEGEVLNGIRHGVGTYTFGTKCVSYQGQWHQGKRHGKGTIYYNREKTSWYEGDWVNNVMDGWGVRRYPSGNIYEGQWKNNARHGEGSMKWLTLGQQYSGQWENGIQHGHGTHTWYLKRSSGSQYSVRNEYVGDFVQGVRQGQGKFCYASSSQYEGGWHSNKKHGKGRFINKSGRVLEGNFVDDRMVEFPASSTNDAQMPELKSESVKEMTGPNTGSSILGSDMALDITSLLARFSEQQRDTELTQVEFVTLRYMAQLRNVYSFYSTLGCNTSPDNTFQLTRLQFWRLLKDCGVHQHGISLAKVDRLISDAEGDPPEEIHSPFGVMLFNKFLSRLIILAHHMYHREIQSSNNVLATCFSKLMKNDILPNATNVKGVFLCDPLCAVEAVNYVNRCWEIYQNVCRLNSSSCCDLTMTMRHFLWMLKDLNLYDEKLTAGKVLEILFADSTAVEDVSHRNLDLEIIFLEFFEALLGCVDVKSLHPDLDRQPETVVAPAGEEVREHSTHLSERSFPLDGRALIVSGHSTASAGSRRNLCEVETSRETAQLSWPEQKVWKQTERAQKAGEQCERELNLWVTSIHLFFSKTFLPAYKHYLLLRRVEEEMQLRKQAQAQAATATAKEATRLRELREAEEKEVADTEPLWENPSASSLTLFIPVP